jgi:hypothetical protein
MIQAKSAQQEVFWNLRECCKNTNLDCGIDLCFGCHNEKTDENLTLYTNLQILGITLFEKMPILQALTNDNRKNKITSGHIQLKL